MAENLNSGIKEYCGGDELPAFDCGSLVIEYRNNQTTFNSAIRKICSLSAFVVLQFTVAQKQISGIFQSIPIRWLSRMRSQ